MGGKTKSLISDLVERITFFPLGHEKKEGRSGAIACVELKAGYIYWLKKNPDNSFKTLTRLDLKENEGLIKKVEKEINDILASRGGKT